MRHYCWRATGKVAATIDDELARRVDAVKALRSPDEQAMAAGLLVLDPAEVEVVELTYRKAVGDADGM